MYNMLKSALDANCQQYFSLNQPVKTGFEQNYIVWMIVANANVTNAWRAMQLLSHTTELEDSL
jgi:hypothetical protein